MKRNQESKEAYEDYVYKQCRYLFQNIKTLRIKSGLSQQELAEATQVPLPYIIALEDQHLPTDFNVKHLYYICYYFQIMQPSDIIEKAL